MKHCGKYCTMKQGRRTNLLNLRAKCDKNSIPVILVQKTNKKKSSSFLYSLPFSFTFSTFSFLFFLVFILLIFRRLMDETSLEKCTFKQVIKNLLNLWVKCNKDQIFEDIRVL